MTLSPPSVCIILVLYNNRLDIAKCLESVFKDPVGQKAFWVFIDNASTDNSIEKIYNCSFFNEKNSRIICNKKNLGFAKAVNQGVTLGQKNFNPDYFFLLNPDAILKKNSLFNLLITAQEKKINLASPYIKDFYEKTWFNGGKINWWKQKTQHRENHLDYLSGCALLIEKKVFSLIGLFDENFFLYYEDADFSLRARKANFTLGIIKNSEIWHNESSSSTSTQKNYYLVKSGLLFFNKHSNFFQKYLWFWPIFWLRFIFHRYFSKKKEIFLSLQDFWYNNTR